jgi:hypothetical protein
MQKKVIIGLAIVLAVGSGKAFAQAAAEAALVHSMSSSAGTSLGTALGHVTGQLAGKTAPQVPRMVQKPAISRARNSSTLKRAAPAQTSPAPAAGGSLIQSIQGAASEAPACRGQAALSAKQTPSACSPQPAKQEPVHPAVITLAAPR